MAQRRGANQLAARLAAVEARLLTAEARVDEGARQTARLIALVEKFQEVVGQLVGQRSPPPSPPRPLRVVKGGRP